MKKPRHRHTPGRTFLAFAAVAAALALSDAGAASLEGLEKQLETLEAENNKLRKRIERLETATQKTSPRAVATTVEKEEDGVRFNRRYSYEVLDPTTNISRKQRLILDSKRSGRLAPNSVYLSGSAIGLANYQKTTSQDKFAYLMRHPTRNNQRTEDAAEAVLHSAQLAFTATMGDWTTLYAEMLYDPGQSFGDGTITDLERNQVQLRRGYVMLGDLEQFPMYLALGKMAIPFGLTDTVSPFTASTVWHSFGGLAFGARAGYTLGGLNFDLMGVQGGAQFRGANVPVDDSNVPSKINNFAANISYDAALAPNLDLLLGASYLKGSAYCQDYPVTHFDPCQHANAAADAYAQLRGAGWVLQGEFARTLKRWPGTFNPDIPEFAASRATSWGVGGKYRLPFGKRVDVSAEFSTFVAGPDGAPWENQDQWVLGLAHFPSSSVKLFAEYIHTDGYVPLNFISGGSADENGNFVGRCQVLGGDDAPSRDATCDDSQTHSENDTDSNIFLVGANIAF